MDTTLDPKKGMLQSSLHTTSPWEGRGPNPQDGPAAAGISAAGLCRTEGLRPGLEEGHEPGT